MPLPEDVVADDPRYASEHPAHHNQIHAAINDLEALAGTLSDVETTTGSQGKVDTHALDTTSVHGISDTVQLPAKNAANTFTADNRFTKILVKEYPGVDPRHPDFGADPTGVADSTAAINAAIEACTDAPNNLTSQRNAVRPLWLGGGEYRIDSPINVQLINYFRMSGSEGATRIRPNVSMARALYLNKVKYSTFENFRIEGLGYGSSVVVDDVIGIETIGEAGQQSSHLNFYGIRIVNTKYLNGISSGSKTTGALAIETMKFYGCLVMGGWTPGETTWATYWQNGFLIGNGTAGNNIAGHVYGTSVAGNRHNVRVNMVPAWSFHGGDFGLGEVDFRIESYGPFLAQGFRSEGSTRLLTGTAGSRQRIRIADVNFVPNVINTVDNKWIDLTGDYTSLILENVDMHSFGDGEIPRIRLNGSTNSATLLGCQFPTSPSNLVYADDGNRPKVMFHGYTEINPANNAVVKEHGLVLHNDAPSVTQGVTGYSRAGVATLVAGTKNVDFFYPTTDYNVLLTAQNSSGTPGELSITSKLANDKFTITSTSATDTRNVYWQIVEPA